jgi:hypothetical protein
LLVVELQAVLLEHLRQLVLAHRVLLVPMELFSPMSVEVEGVEPVEWVSMAPEELPVTLLQQEDVVRITLVTQPYMAQAILQTLTQEVDPQVLYLEVQVGLKPPL